MRLPNFAPPQKTAKRYKAVENREFSTALHYAKT